MIFNYSQTTCLSMFLHCWSIDGLQLLLNNPSFTVPPLLIYWWSTTTLKQPILHCSSIVNLLMIFNYSQTTCLTLFLHCWSIDGLQLLSNNPSFTVPPLLIYWWSTTTLKQPILHCSSIHYHFGSLHRNLYIEAWHIEIHNCQKYVLNTSYRTRITQKSIKLNYIHFHPKNIHFSSSLSSLQ